MKKTNATENATTETIKKLPDLSGKKKDISAGFKIVYYFLQFTWGIVQNIMGLLFLILLKVTQGKRVETKWYYGALLVHLDADPTKFGGVGLGMFIFGNKNFLPQYTEEYKQMWMWDTAIHEYGHSIQSIILGPLFWPVIAIPSFLWCNLKVCKMIHRKCGLIYDSFYPERWCEHLGKKITGRKMYSDEMMIVTGFWRLNAEEKQRFGITPEKEVELWATMTKRGGPPEKYAPLFPPKKKRS